MKGKHPIVYLWEISQYKILFLMQITINFFLSFIAVSISQIAEHVIDENIGSQNEVITKMILLVLAGTIFSYLIKFLRHYYAISFKNNLKQISMKKLMRCRFEYLDREHSGKLINKLSQDVTKASEYISGGFPEFIENVIVFSISFFYLAGINWMMMSACMICIPVIMFLTKKFAKPTYETMDVFRNRLDEAMILAKDSIKNIYTEKIYGIGHVRRHEFNKKIDDAVTSYVQYEKCMATTAPIKYLINSAPTLICILIGFISIYMGNVTKGELVAFILLLGNISSPMARFLGNVTAYKEASVSMSRVVEVLELSEEEN